MRNNYSVKRYGYTFNVNINFDEKRITVKTYCFFDPKGEDNLKPCTFQSSAKCHPSDRFSLRYGIDMCIYRIIKNMYGKEKEIHNRKTISLHNTYWCILKNLENKIRPAEMLKECEIK